MNKEQVMNFLPHRDPFLFIDSVETVLYPGKDLNEGDIIPAKDTLGAEVKAHYRTRADHPIFAGHFPGNPILPGVVQVEMMAQGSAFGLIKTMEDPYQSNMEVALISVNDAKFRKPVSPEMDLIIKTKCTKCRGPFFTHEVQLYHDDVLMSEATIMASVKL